MKQEDKELLLKDLCARLLYGVKVSYKTVGWEDKYHELSPEIISNMLIRNDVELKPYLRPMSSMTKEERMEFEDICTTIAKDRTHFVMEGSIDSNYMLEKFYWLLKNHFDYLGLIPNGLAIRVTEENNPYK